MSTVDIPTTYGSLLLGGLVASLLSGCVVIQALVYVKLYPTDNARLKLLVFTVCILDFCHTSFIWSALWTYIVDNYGEEPTIDAISWSIAFSIITTAILTFLVHVFFARRIFMLSQKNWWIMVPIVSLAILRLVSASVTTAEMINYQKYTHFRERIPWIFTAGLTLSFSVDVLITTSLFFLLQSARTGSTDLNAMIDALIRIGFETGSLTCAGTIISVICWLTMPTNLIFMGLHFVIGKLYANSLLVTLNTRQGARSLGSNIGHVAPVYYLNDLNNRRPQNITSNSITIANNPHIPTLGQTGTKNV